MVAPAVGAAIITEIGAIISGLSSGAMSSADAARQLAALREQLREEGRQFDISNARDYELGSRKQSESEVGSAAGLFRQRQLAPLSDQAAYALQGRLGATPTAFAPRDMFSNPQGPTSQGGVDFGALAARQNQYRPGAGGFSDPASMSMYDAFLRQLGYQNQPGNMWSNVGPPPAPNVIPPGVPATYGALTPEQRAQQARKLAQVAVPRGLPLNKLILGGGR